MNTLAIKLNSAVMDENNNINKRVFQILLLAFIVVFALYFYFLSQTILNVIDRKNLESSVGSLSSQADSLEIKYIELSKTIDYNMALSMGFKESEDTHFASRKQAVGSLVEKTNEL
jgi:hypothetical protein